LYHFEHLFVGSSDIGWSDQWGGERGMPDERCLIFQRDHSILLSTGSVAYPLARDQLRRFAELTQSSGAYHTYRVTDLSLWSAAASGMVADEILEVFDRFGEHPAPRSLVTFVQEFIRRYGVLTLEGTLGSLRLVSTDHALLTRIASDHDLKWDGPSLVVPDQRRGWLKSTLADAGYPVVDKAAIAGAGGNLSCVLRSECHLRPYQVEAVRRFMAQADSGGVVLLPCGSGKTLVGVAIAARLSAPTLIITPSRTIAEQWRRAFLDSTTLLDSDVGYHHARRAVKPVTIVTYQALTTRVNGRASNLGSLLDFPWGLVIYDEVHSLPADVFRSSAALQSLRRLGLTATLVREDGRERDVFSLVGPTIYSVPWRLLEARGWITPVDCVEVHVHPPHGRHATVERLLAAKLRVLLSLATRHEDEPVLVIAHRLLEVAAAARALDSPMLTGATPVHERRALYDAFRNGALRSLVLSRVGNVGVDLPDASVLIQLSGAFGSRQEEAQRVGRLLRPKRGRRATFYSLVGVATREEDYARRRQHFLVDQGYRYQVVDEDSVLTW
jgi:DNA excision repair protein ERCC-3